MLSLIPLRSALSDKDRADSWPALWVSADRAEVVNVPPAPDGPGILYDLRGRLDDFVLPVETLPGLDATDQSGG